MMDITAEYTETPTSELGVFTSLAAPEREERGYDKQLN